MIAEEDEHADAQYRCILTVILKLRMFNSHVLVAQDVVKEVVAVKENMTELLGLVDKNMEGTNPNRAIVQLIQEMVQHQRARRTPRQEPGKLGSQFYEFVRELTAGENNDQRFERMTCALCKQIPTETLVTSCMHLFCEDCLMSLAELTENSGTSRSICPVCEVAIDEAEHFQPRIDVQSTTFRLPSKKDKKTKGQQQQQRKKKLPWNSKNPFFPSGNLGDEEEEDEDDLDWVPYAAELMPSAKLSRIRQIIRQWITDSPDTKIVIFTQFRVMATILISMCMKEKWGYTLVRETPLQP